VRSYRVRLSGPDSLQAPAIARHGPENILAIAEGRGLDEALKLVALLFAVCPSAHQAALLRAAERAGGIALPAEQAAAREAVVLSEAIIGCVWRTALYWPRLAGAAPAAHRIAVCRKAHKAMVDGLYPQSWAAPGGAPIRLDPHAVLEAFDILRRETEAQGRDLETVLARLDNEVGSVIMPSCRGLGNDLTDPALSPQGQCAEESPRTLYAGSTELVRLEDWFVSQYEHTKGLCDSLFLTLQNLIEMLPEHEQKNQLTDELAITAFDGTGPGTAMTARGRLRHAVTLGSGVIRSWRATAPTDWNFANPGPVVRYLEANGPDDRHKLAPWIIAALDPCAPCEIEDTGAG